MYTEVILVIPIIQNPALTDEMIVEQMMKQLQILVEVGALKGEIDNILKDFTISKEAGYIDAVIDNECLIFPDKLQTVAAGLCPKYEIPEEYRVQDNIVENNGFKLFSAATIQERLRIASRNPRLRFRYTIMDYKRYWKNKGKALMNDKEALKNFRNMFLTDMMGMFTEILPFIEEGKQLATLVGLSQVSTSLNKSARELSLAYKRALTQEGSTGAINKTLYQKLKKNYTEFMMQLLNVVFPGMVGDAQEQEEVEAPKGRSEVVEQKEESRKYSRTSDGRISLFSNEEFYVYGIMNEEAMVSRTTDPSKIVADIRSIKKSIEDGDDEYTKADLDDYFVLKCWRDRQARDLEHNIEAYLTMKRDSIFDPDLFIGELSPESMGHKKDPKHRSPYDPAFEGDDYSDTNEKAIEKLLHQINSENLVKDFIKE